MQLQQNTLIDNKTLLFVTSSVLNKRKDCTASKKYRNVFIDLETYLANLYKVYGIDLTPLTNDHQLCCTDRLQNVLLAGLPLMVPNGVVRHVGKMINRSVPIIVICEETVPCDFININHEEKPKLSFSCVRRDFAKFQSDSNGDNWNNSFKCYKDSDNEFDFGMNNKICDRSKSLKELINIDMLEELIAAIAVEFEGLRHTDIHRIPIFRFSTFLDIILWFHLIAKDTIRIGLEKEANRQKQETTLLYDKLITILFAK